MSSDFGIFWKFIFINNYHLLLLNFLIGFSIGLLSDLISSFTRSLNLTRGNSFTVNAREGQYIYLLVPYSLKDISFSVGGFEGGFFIIDDNYQFTRYEGVTLRCVLFRSDNPGLGSTTVTIK